MPVTIDSLHVYPVKSAAGFRCESAELTATGLQHDREWMVVDANGRFLTQRNEPRLALLKTQIRGDTLSLANPLGNGPDIAIDHAGERHNVVVWRAQCAAFDAGGEVAQFLSDWLGKPLRLVRFDQSQPRLSNPDWTAGRVVPTLFTDGYPLLVLSRESIADLAARVGHDLPIERFRPNVLIRGVDPYGEDSIVALSQGEICLQLTKACTRCAITTIDQHTGVGTGDEPLRTLRSYRYDVALAGVVLGRNAYATSGVGALLRSGIDLTVHGRSKDD
jgi:uncharacterized protein